MTERKRNDIGRLVPNGSHRYLTDQDQRGRLERACAMARQHEIWRNRAYDRGEHVKAARHEMRARRVWSRYEHGEYVDTYVRD